MKRIAVIMTVFNRKQKTKDCLENLYKIHIPVGYALDVFLTNDGCTDGTPQMVRENFPQVHIIDGDGSLFWNRGMYVAWEAAAKGNYDYYLWLNDDVVLYHYALDVLLEAAEETKSMAVICGAVEDQLHTRMTYGGELKWKKFIAPNGTTQKIDYSQGNIVLVPRFIYDKVGNLDKYYGHSRGDSDYGLMVTKKGLGYYQAKCFCGSCELHEKYPKCFDPHFKVTERWKALNKKTGLPLNEVWYYWNKHRNIFFASYECFKVIVRCLFPNIWIKTGHATFQ